MVDSHMIHTSSARLIICPDMSHPVHVFGAEWITYLEESHSTTQSSSARWVTYLDASYLAAHSTNAGYIEVDPTFYIIFLGHTSYEVVTLVIKLLLFSFQSRASSKALHILSIYRYDHSSEPGATESSFMLSLSSACSYFCIFRFFICYASSSGLASSSLFSISI